MSTLAALRARLPLYVQLTRLDRPIGIWLLLWPTWWALWIAGNGTPSLTNVLVFTAGVVLMRSAGCAINDYADRDFDRQVRRTKDRPLAAGRLAPREALGLFAGLALVAFALALLLNRETVLMSVGGLALAACYPFMKRWTHLPQAVLGAAFGWAVPMAFVAETGHVPLAGWVLYAANVAWTVAYDTYYAMVDREDDVAAGVKSTAILFGRADRLVIGLLQLATLGLLALAGRQVDTGWPGATGLGWPYLAGLGAMALMFAWQQWATRRREPAACFAAFLHNSWAGAAVFAGIFLAYTAT